MQQIIQQTYRHIVQQHIVRQQLVQREAAPRTVVSDAEAEARAQMQGIAWEMGGILALFAAAVASGVLAQAHLG